MNLRLLLLGMAFAAMDVLAGELPFISISPQSTVVAPGSNAVLTVESTNATAYQWRFNGEDIPWGTASSLVVTNAQTNNVGYYMAVAKNGMGWTPSQLAYLSVVWSNGIVPFYTASIPSAQARYGDLPCLELHNLIDQPITNGTARLFAGPAWDQLSPVGTTRPVQNGYIGPEGLTRLVPTVPPGAYCYYRVDITYTFQCIGEPVTQPSRTIALVAGGDSIPVPQPGGISFPNYIEWPDHSLVSSPTSRVAVVGEEMTFYGYYFSVSGYPLPLNWRKDGKFIPQRPTALVTVHQKPS